MNKRHEKISRSISINFTVSEDEDMALAAFIRDRGFKSMAEAMRYMIKTMAIDPKFVTAKEVMSPPVEKSDREPALYIVASKDSRWAIAVCETTENAQIEARKMAASLGNKVYEFLLAKVIGKVIVDCQPKSKVSLS